MRSVGAAYIRYNMQLQLRIFVLAAVQIISMTIAQGQQRITIQIQKESQDGSEVYDTTFVAPDNFDLDSWLETTRLQQTNPGESVSTTIIISDEQDQYAEADVFRPEEEEKREPGMMGVYLNDGSHLRRGVPIESIIPEGAADRAGLQRGDTIISMNGRSVKNFEELVAEKKGSYAGDSLPIEYRRGAEVYATTLLLTGRKPVAEDLEKVKTHSPKSYLGVYTKDLTKGLARDLGLEDLQGVYLKGIVAGSAADEAGLEDDDVIVIMNGREIQAAWELSEVLRDLDPGDELSIGYIRDGEEQETVAILGARPSPSPEVEERPRRMLIEETRAFLGVTLATESHSPGVRVLGVERHSAADEAGLEEGDVIMRIGGNRTENYDSLASVMRSLSPDEEVAIVYLRDERRRRTSATLGHRTSTTWVRVESEKNLDPEAIISEVRAQDRRIGDQLARNMKAPSLEMDFFEFYPNPNSGIFTINFEPADQGTVDIRVYSPTGALVFEEQLEDFSGNYRREINLGEATTSGLYLIQVNQNGKGMVQKMIVR